MKGKGFESMARIINLGINSATTKDWLNATRHMKLTAFDPCFRDSRASLAEFSNQAPTEPTKNLPHRNSIKKK
jgi:hypothetical protein